jgi:hypothetical protein
MALKRALTQFRLGAIRHQGMVTIGPVARKTTGKSAAFAQDAADLQLRAMSR